MLWCKRAQTSQSCLLKKEVVFWKKEVSSATLQCTTSSQWCRNFMDYGTLEGVKNMLIERASWPLNSWTFTFLVVRPKKRNPTNKNYAQRKLHINPQGNTTLTKKTSQKTRVSEILPQEWSDLDVSLRCPCRSSPRPASFGLGRSSNGIFHRWHQSMAAVCCVGLF